MTKLDYISGSTAIPTDCFGISPSSLGNFFSEPHNWYREFFQGIKTFGQSTATVLGTCVHYIAECHVKGEEVDHLEIAKYIYEQCCHISLDDFPVELDEAHDFLHSNARLDFDIYHILEQYPIMSAALIATIDTLTPARAEELAAVEVIPGVWASGSIDLQCGTVEGKNVGIFDYKTTSALSPPKSIEYKHKLQLLTYAYIKTKLGTPIKTINIIYVTANQVNRVGTSGKPLADYPSVTNTLTHYVTQEDMEFIESLLKLVAETVLHVKAHPEQAYLLFKDYRLKSEVPKPKFTF